MEPSNQSYHPGQIELDNSSLKMVVKDWDFTGITAISPEYLEVVLFFPCKLPSFFSKSYQTVHNQPSVKQPVSAAAAPLWVLEGCKIPKPSFFVSIAGYVTP